MSKIGTFGSFTQARLAIYAAQLGLSVTGNNISNVNTPGYTRQRLDQESFRTGGADRYQSSFDVRVGNGVLPTGVSQLRDPYLDIRFRNDNSNVGAMDAKLTGLDRIAAILDEVGKGGDVPEGEEFGIIAYHLGNLFKALSGLSDNTGQQDYDVQVRSAADTLCQVLRSYASNLSEMYDDTVKAYNQNITQINNLLSNIRDLNTAIRKSDIHGDKALELRDQRNNLIDELSKYMKIDVTYTTEDIGAGKTVEKLIISLGNANPDSSVHTDESILVDGRYCAQLMTATPKLNEEKPGDKTTFQYMTETGDLTNNLEQAQMLPKENTDEATKADFPYIDAQGNPVKDPDDAYKVPVPNPDYKPYLDKNGNPTADIDEAEMIDIPNFGLRLSELRDEYDRVLESVVKMEEREISKDLFGNGEPTTVLLPDGTSKYTTYRATQQRLLMKNDGLNGKPIMKDPDGNPFKYLIKNADGSYTGTNNWKEASREVVTTYYAQDYITTPSTPVDLDDNDLYGALQSQRELLTENGEFSTLDSIKNLDESAASKRGIPYFQKMLDLLAEKIATSFNENNQGYLTNKDGNYIDKDAKEIQLAGAGINRERGLTEAQKQALIADGCVDADGNPDLDRFLEAKDGIFTGGNLFSNNGDTDDATGINASNITISASWSRGPLIVNSFLCPNGDTKPASTDSSNILVLQGLGEQKMVYYPQTLVGDAQSEPLFTGTFEDMWTNINTILGNDQMITSTLLDNYYEKTVELDSSRASVSSVDFNDEAMNLMQYAKSYNAACRLMTTLDSVLDKLINGTGLTT